MTLARVRITAAERLPTNRVSADDLLQLLHAEADRTGNERLRVTKSALRNWKHRPGVPISPGAGYNPVEVRRYLLARGDHGQRRRAEVTAA